MYRLAMIMIQGQLNQPQSVRDGLKWLRLAAKYANEKYPTALYELAMLHDQGVRNFVWSDHAYLVQLLKQAADLGHVPSMFKLGKAYAQGTFGLSVNPKASFEYYALAAQRDHAEVSL
jgi:TPR repeat protein